MKNQGFFNALISVVIISIVIISVISFTLYRTRIIGPIIILLGFIPWIPLKLSGRTIKSTGADIVFGAIDTGILGIAALIGASFAGVIGAIVGGAVGDSITTGFAPGMPPEEFYDLLNYIPGPETDQIGALARELKVHVMLPIYEKGKEKNVIMNSSILISDEGEIAGIYRKTHPFPTERLGGGGWTTPGKEAVVTDTKLGKIGMMICYDGDFPELSRVLAIQGAEIITRPSALLRSFEIWDMTNKARAYDNHVYVVATNSVGADAEENYYFGSSMIISPIAQKLAQARGTEEIISAKLDPNPLKRVTYGANSPMIFDHLEDRNLEVYKDILKEAKSPFEPAKRISYNH